MAGQVTVQPDLNSFRVQALIIEYKDQGCVQELLLTGPLTPSCSMTHCSYVAPYGGSYQGRNHDLTAWTPSS